MLQIQTLVIRFTTSLQPQLRAVEARDPKFADQLRRSLLSVGLNLGEGYGASGLAKRRAYRIARGEAAELEMGLEMAAALGYCQLNQAQREFELHESTQWTSAGRTTVPAQPAGARRAASEVLQRILATLQKLANPQR